MGSENPICSRIMQPWVIVETASKGEGGKGSTCIAGGKPAEGIGRTRQIGSTP